MNKTLRIGVVDSPLSPWVYPDCFKFHLESNANHKCDLGAAIEVIYLVLGVLQMEPNFVFYPTWTDAIKAVQNGSVDTTVPEIGANYDRLKYDIQFIHYVFYNSMEICLNYCIDITQVKDVNSSKLLENLTLVLLENLTLVLPLTVTITLCSFTFYLGLKMHSCKCQNSHWLEGVHFWFDAFCIGSYYQNKIQKSIFLRLLIACISIQAITVYLGVIPAKLVYDSMGMSAAPLQSWDQFYRTNEGRNVQVVVYGPIDKSYEDILNVGNFKYTLVTPDHFASDEILITNMVANSNVFLLLNTLYIRDLMMNYAPENYKMKKKCLRSEICEAKGSDTLIVSTNNMELKEKLEWAVLHLHSGGLILKISKKYNMLQGTEGHRETVPTLVHIQPYKILVFYGFGIALALCVLFCEICAENCICNGSN